MSDKQHATDTRVIYRHHIQFMWHHFET